MKKTTKILLMLVCVFAVMLSLATMSFAKELIVNGESDEENGYYISLGLAYNDAVDGDTIVIKMDTNGTINFDKSITYVIDGGYKLTAGASASVDGKTVSIYARNGNATFTPSGSMWLHVQSGLPNTTWNLGALDDSTLTVDLTNTTVRLLSSYTKLKEINLGKGTIVENLTQSNNNSSSFFYADTISIYEGSIIRGNKTVNYVTLIRAQNLNIYGGEIYGNNFGVYGLAHANHVRMYGGSIHDNYTDYTGNSGIPGSALFNSMAGQTPCSSQHFYAGEIYNNYLLTNASSKQSVLVSGGISYVDGVIGTGNTCYTGSWPVSVVKENGVYGFESAPTDEGTVAPIIYYSGTPAQYSVIFKNSDSSVIDAFMVKADGSIMISVSGADTVTAPTEITSWASQANSCKAVQSVALDAQGTYYAAIAHATEDDFDCTTELLCDRCGEILAVAMEHDIKTTITYTSLIEDGTKRIGCANEGCLHGETTAASALFSYKGYSYTVYDGKYSISQAYGINRDAISEYESCGNKVDFGVVFATENTSTNGDLIVDANDANNPGKDKIKVTNLTNTEMKFSRFDAKLIDIAPNNQDVGIYVCAYVQITDSEDNTETYYITNGACTNLAEAKSTNEIVSLIEG